MVSLITAHGKYSCIILNVHMENPDEKSLQPLRYILASVQYSAELLMAF